MGKSLKNAVSPDDIYREYGADTLRLYEMFMGPLDKERPWNTADIVGVHRFLQRLWRNVVDEETGEVARRRRARRRRDAPRAAPHDRGGARRHGVDELQHRDRAAVRVEQPPDAVVARRRAPREVAEPLVLMVAPLAPHIAEELWARLGHADTLAYEAFPVADASLLVEDTVEVPVQVNGKVRARITVAAGADAAAHEAAARGDAATSPRCSTARRCARS